MFNVSNHADINNVKPGTRNPKRVRLGTLRDAQPKQFFDKSSQVIQAREIPFHAI